MINKILDIAFFVKTLYQRLEYLESQGLKDSLEYKQVLNELRRNKKMEEDDIAFQSVSGEELRQLMNDLREKYPDLKKEVTISTEQLPLEYLGALRVMNELVMANSSITNTVKYELALSNYLTIDEFMLALSLASDNIQVKYHLAYLIPDIEKELLNNNFEVKDHPFIYNDTLMNIYNVDSLSHQNYKDYELTLRFKEIIKAIMVEDDFMTGKENYFYLLENILKSLMILASDKLRYKLKETISKILSSQKCESKASIILENVINSNNLDIPLRVTF